MADEFAATAEAEAADRERVFRTFVGFTAGLLGVDQTNLNDDAVAGNRTGQYIVANPNGAYSVQGQSVSNQQSLLGTTASGSLVLSPVLLLIGGALLYFAFSK